MQARGLTKRLARADERRPKGYAVPSQPVQAQRCEWRLRAARHEASTSARLPGSLHIAPVTMD